MHKNKNVPKHQEPYEQLLYLVHRLRKWFSFKDLSSNFLSRTFFLVQKSGKIKIPKSGQKSTFYQQNQNSDTTFISSTLKVEEIKVVSEFRFSK